jgi:hypothetical protein
VIEGHRDMLSAILLGLDVIMLPYAGFRLKEPTAMQKEVASRDVVFIVEDEAAFKCMHRVAKSIQPYASAITMMSFAKGRKVDLSDCVRTKNSIREVIDGLKNKQFD